MRLEEKRTEIYEMIQAIEDINSEEGQSQLAYITERFESTFNDLSDDEDGISDKNVILSKIERRRLNQLSNRNNAEVPKVTTAMLVAEENKE